MSCTPQAFLVVDDRHISFIVEHQVQAKHIQTDLLEYGQIIGRSVHLHEEAGVAIAIDFHVVFVGDIAQSFEVGNDFFF